MQSYMLLFLLEVSIKLSDGKKADDCSTDALGRSIERRRLTKGRINKVVQYLGLLRILGCLTMIHHIKGTHFAFLHRPRDLLFAPRLRALQFERYPVPFACLLPRSLRHNNWQLKNGDRVLFRAI